MEALVTDTVLFKRLFQYVTKFIDVAHFEIGEDCFRVRSIDPHDFCYVDLRLEPGFFERYNSDGDWQFTIKASRLSKLLPTLNSSEIKLSIDEGHIEFSTEENWESTFRVRWIRSGSEKLAEPRNLNYELTLKIPASELASLVRKATAISHELVISALPPDKLILSSVKENYSFTAQPTVPYFQVEVKEPINLTVLSDYLKTLRYFISKCDQATLFLGENKPLRVDLQYGAKGVFSFSFSHKKQKRRKPRKRRGGTSWPRVSMNKFEQYVLQLAKYPEGLDPKIFEMSGLETKGGDYWRLSDILTLAYKENGKIKLTPQGEAFVSLYEKKSAKAKKFLHLLAKNTIKSYSLLLTVLESPTAKEQIFQKLNKALKNVKSPPIDHQDLNTMLHFGKWCGAIVKAANLYSYPNES